MCLDLCDYQFKESRYSYGSTYLNSRVTTNQKHSIDSQKTKRKELQRVIIQKKTIKSEKEKRKEEKTLEEQIHSQIFLLFSKQSYNVIFYAGIRGWEHAMNYSFQRQRKNWVEWRMQSEKAGVGDGPSCSLSTSVWGCVCPDALYMVTDAMEPRGT